MEDKILSKVPADMEVVKPVSGQLSSDQWKKYFDNILNFSAPALVVLFGLLADGVSWRSALLMTLYVFYGLIRDYFKKRSEDNAYLRKK